MDTHGGAPYWLLRDALCDVSDPLPARADVVVIGSGITGAVIADALAASGRTVAVIDRRSMTEGSTAASTALLMYELDLEFTQLAAQIGDLKAVRAYQRLAVALRQLEELARGLPSGVDYHRRDSLYVAAKAGHVDRLHREVAARRFAGLDAEWIGAEELREEFGIAGFGAIRTRCGAEVDPVRLARALLNRSRDQGATVSLHTRVTRVESRDAGVRVVTDRGEIEATWCVCATGYETPEGLLPPTLAFQSSFAFVTEPMPGTGPLADGTLVWESSRPYLYLRRTPDQRLMIGGADIERTNSAARDALIPRRQRLLLQQAEERFPGLNIEVSRAWSGTIASAPDSLPYIGAFPATPRVLLTLGAGGNGIPFAVIAAQLVLNSCEEKTDPDADLFHLERTGRA